MQALEIRSRLLGAAGSSGTAQTNLCLEPISARGVSRESPASPPACSWSQFPERKSACGSGPGRTCSEEWRCRVRRCAWLDQGAPRPAHLGKWAVAREKLVLATREPAGRDPRPLWGRGMSSGFPGVEGLREGGRSGWYCRGLEEGWGWGWVRRRATGPPEAQPGSGGCG